MFRVSLAALVAAATLAIAVTVAPADDVPVATGTGWFHAPCAFSHSAPVDPIVFPGQPDTSHLHDFFGAKTLDENSTNDSIREGDTSCVRDDEAKRPEVPRSDRSAYWVPTAVINGQPVPKGETTAAYTVGRREMNLVAPPPGYRVIAGDSSGTSGPFAGRQRIYLWRCGSGTVQPATATTAPLCSTPDLRLDINFPDCWDGQHLDSPNHKSHAAYSQPVGDRYACPPGFPVAIPQLSLRVRYLTIGGPNLKLVRGSGASRTLGDITTSHADWMNGWLEGKLEHLTEVCLNADEYCGATRGPVEGH